MPYINAMAIFLKEILKSIAYLVGYVQQPAKEGLIGGLTDSSGELSENLGEVNEQLNDMLGLLSFDKFNVLGSANTEGMSDDIELILNELYIKTEALQDAMSNVSMKANDIADSMFKWLGFTDKIIYTYNELGEVIDTRVVKVLKEGYNNLESIGNIIASIMIVALAPKIIALTKSIIGFNGALSMSANLITILNKVAMVGLVYYLLTLTTQWKELTNAQRMMYSSLVAILTVITIISNKKLFVSLYASINKLTNSMTTFSISIGVVVIGIMSLINVFSNWSNMSSWQRAIGLLGALTTTLLGVAMAMGVFQSTLSVGLASAGIIAGIAMVTTSIASVKKDISNIPSQFADGGFPTTGEMFIARERGPEFVGSMGGKTTVANNYQIEQGIEEASYRGFTRAMQENSNGANRLVIDGKNVDDSAFVRAIMPALRMENTRTGGR